MSAGFYNPLSDEPDESGQGAENPPTVGADALPCVDGVPDSKGGESEENPAKVEALRHPEEETRKAAKAPRKPMIEFLRPSEIAAYVTPENHFLVGDALIQRGGMTIFAGPGGVGKSRAIFGLAVSAARGESSWMGFPIHYGFKTMIIQSENGLPRLSKDFQRFGDSGCLDGRLMVSSPPDGMLAMKNPMFRADVIAAAREFGPDLIVCDPLNSMVSDSMERDITELFGHLKEVVAGAGTNPALLVVHHLRKPREGDKHRGRSMANLLAGSYLVVSSARAVLTLQAATDAEDDQHVVLTVAKCNDGEMSPRSAWRRTDGGFFESADDFDWDAFDGQSGPMSKIREEHVLRVFDYGQRKMSQSVAVTELMEMTGAKRSAVHAAIKNSSPAGRLGHLLEADNTDGFLRLSAEGLKRSQADDDE